MIEKKKKYRTRDGSAVRIYAVDGKSDYPVHGAVQCFDMWMCMSWSSRGICGEGEESKFDLVEVKPRYKLSMWVNVYPDSKLYTRKAADRAAGPNRIACIKVDFDFKEGQGLD